MKHPLIIGAGGVASYLLPVLIKAFHPDTITVIDKDILEERNLDRQQFSEKQVGEPKALALAELHIGLDAKILTMNEWFSNSTDVPEDVDIIICVADNHLARHHALEAGDRMEIPVIIGGNEYLDNEAYIYYPHWKGTNRDPRIRYSTIVTAGDEGSPLACTGLAQIASPQLAIANFGCAYKILHLLWSWMVVKEQEQLSDQALAHLPFELSSSLTTHNALT